MPIGSVQPLVPPNPCLGLRAGLEAKNRLADAIAAHDRYMKSSMVDLKLPRFGGVFDGFVDYGSVVATSIIASYAIGER